MSKALSGIDRVTLMLNSHPRTRVPGKQYRLSVNTYLDHLGTSTYPKVDDCGLLACHAGVLPCVQALQKLAVVSRNVLCRGQRSFLFR